MPFISVEVMAGRTREQRERFVEAITAAAVQELGAAPENVRIRMIELQPGELAKAGRFMDAPSSDPRSAPNGRR